MVFNGVNGIFHVGEIKEVKMDKDRLKNIPRRIKNDLKLNYGFDLVPNDYDSSKTSILKRFIIFRKVAT